MCVHACKLVCLCIKKGRMQSSTQNLGSTYTSFHKLWTIIPLKGCQLLCHFWHYYHWCKSVIAVLVSVRTLHHVCIFKCFQHNTVWASRQKNIISSANNIVIIMFLSQSFIFLELNYHTKQNVQSSLLFCDINFGLHESALDSVTCRNLPIMNVSIITYCDHFHHVHEVWLWGCICRKCSHQRPGTWSAKHPCPLALCDRNERFSIIYWMKI